MNITPLLEKLKQQKLRITKARRDVIEALSKGPLTIHELQQYMTKLGHPNVQTIYNNIHSLEDANIIFTTLNEQVKYYHLVDNQFKNGTQINIRCHDNKGVFFIPKEEITKQLKSVLGLNDFNVDHLDITIQGQCKHLDEPHCEQQKTCAIQQLKQLSLS